MDIGEWRNGKRGDLLRGIGITGFREYILPQKAGYASFPGKLEAPNMKERLVTALHGVVWGSRESTRIRKSYSVCFPPGAREISIRDDSEEFTL
jgi:hypothetical protein